MINIQCTIGIIGASLVKTQFTSGNAGVAHSVVPREHACRQLREMSDRTVVAQVAETQLNKLMRRYQLLIEVTQLLWPKQSNIILMQLVS